MKPTARFLLAIAAVAALSATAIDLPWVYDSSGRTEVVVKNSGVASHAGEFATMAGHWSYESNSTTLNTGAWHGVLLIVR